MPAGGCPVSSVHRPCPKLFIEIVLQYLCSFLYFQNLPIEERQSIGESLCCWKGQREQVAMLRSPSAILGL